MKCPNCGAEYEEKKLNCPFCKSENSVEADRRFKRELMAADRRISFLKYLPNKIVTRFSRRGAFILVIILSVVLAGGIAIAVSSSFKEKQETELRKNYRDVLEGYFMNGQYELMYDYYGSHELIYGSLYQKYYEVGSVYQSILDIRHSIACLNGDEKDYKYGISFALYGCSKVMRTVREALNDGVPRGNEEVLEGFSDEVNHYLERLSLTQNEVGDILNAESLDDPVFDATTETLMARLGLAE